VKRREFITLLGGAVAWPLMAHTQPSAMPVIGFMSARAMKDSPELTAAFRLGLRDAGFVEGQTISIEYRWANGDYARLPALASDLVNRRVAVLVALGGEPSAFAAKRGTSTIPIVFGIGSDPVEGGLVESLGRPGGNATGYTLLATQLEPKRLGLLRDLVPGAAVIGVLVNSDFPIAARQLKDIEIAAGNIGQRIFVAKASSDNELQAALASMIGQRVGALIVAASPYFDTRRDQIIAFTAQNRLPAIYHLRGYAAAGGLISYGPRITDAYQQAGIYTGRILHGAKPSELPVIQPTKFELVINMKTANALGLAVPNSMQLLADEVIE